jgi:hypothetical protein
MTATPPPSTPGYSVYGGPEPLPAAMPRNTAGRVALIMGIVLVALRLGQIVLSFLIPSIVRSTEASLGTVAGLLGAVGVVVTVFAAATAIVGLVGLSRAGQPRGAAGAGAALGLAALAEGIFALLIGPLASALG